MDPSLIADNLLNPTILFFALGTVAAAMGSDLEIPAPLSKFLSLYLLVAIGLEGGVALAASGGGAAVWGALGAAVVLSAATPVWVYFVLRRWLAAADAAALAAACGSVSAVTFMAARAFLEVTGTPSGGYMVAALALMESPAILSALALAARARGTSHGLGRSLRDACLHGPIVLLIGSFAIGLVAGPARADVLSPFTHEIFKGMLALFLLDVGLSVARRLKDLQTARHVVVVAGLVIPIVNALAGIGVAAALGLGEGDAFLLAILAGSASYIAVPAALRMALPEANTSLYVPLPLAVTFPFNVVIGFPLYLSLIRTLWA